MDRTMTQNASGLTDKQLATLRAKLESEKARLLAAVRIGTEDNQPGVGDIMDQAEDVSEHEEAAARTTRDSRRPSGEPIGYGRLEAIPWTRLTVQEEEIAER
jgi:RNA polymerase-binding transcription factor DksA